MAEMSLEPVVRFPEFIDNWKEKKIGALGEFIGGGTPDSSKKEFWQGDIPWISSSDVNENSIHFLNKTRFITEDAINKSATKKVPKGSILMVSRVGIGKFAVADSVLCTSQDFTNLVTNHNEYFLAYYFLARSTRFVRLSQGTSIQGFTTKDIKSAKFLIPQPNEQQKIAAFLTAVDERIHLLQKKKSNLEEYKKGVMKKIFSQEIRFKDGKGNNFPEWKEMKLGEICNKQSSNISANSLEESGGDYKIYGATGFLQFVDFYREEEDYISIVKDGAGVGRILLCEGKSSVLGTLDILKPKEENNIKFLYALISKIRFEKYITGSTIPHIYFKDYSKEKVSVPILAEQNKIAAFLTSLDESIESIGVEIEGTRTYKKGLLQKMFI